MMHRAAFVSSFSLLVLLVGCREPHGERAWPGALDVATQSGEQYAPSVVRLSPGSPERAEDERAVLREIASRHEEVLDGNPPPRVLAETELLFLANGQLADLAGFYALAVERQGQGSVILPRLAWVYQRLGLDDRALELARQAVDERGEDPFALFVLAFCLGQQADRFDDPFHDVIDLLDKVFTLEPNFSVPGVVDNRSLRAELATLRSEHAHHHPK